MPRFSSAGIGIEYLDEGEGPPVLLVHGFASNHVVNWVNTSWTRTLVRSGRRVIAIDNRGHGASEKLYEPEQYNTRLMAEDTVRLMDHLGLGAAAVMGYSMGARISAFAALAAPDRVSALVLSGLAANLVHGVGGGPLIAAALEAPSLDGVTDPGARAFRVFADQTKSDRKALAACIRASRQTLSASDVAGIRAPTLVVVGSDDAISGSADELAAMIPGAQAVTLPGRDHMTAVGDRGHKEAVLSFLDEWLP
ncbi:MAG: alpha/beta hydrolase [Pseudomonadota bacterium]